MTKAADAGLLVSRHPDLISRRPAGHLLSIPEVSTMKDPNADQVTSNHSLSSSSLDIVKLSPEPSAQAAQLRGPIW